VGLIYVDFFSFKLSFLLNNFATLDFFLAAVFFFIIQIFAHLSMIL
jgi:hypothetical protein